MDLFILGVIFYEVLCGIHPFIGTTKSPYENSNTPEQKIKDGLFPFGAKGKYFEVIAPPHNNYQKLPYKVQNLFLNCFDVGINIPNLRATTIDWIDVLTIKPQVNFFKADRETIIAGVEVTLSWDVEDAEEIFISEGIGKVENTGSVTTKPQSNRSFKLTATNKFGVDEKEINVTAFPTPVIESLKIPMPDFSSRLSLNPIQISSPRIDVSVNLGNNANAKLPFIEPSIEVKSIRPLHMEKTSIISLSRIFESIKKQLSLPKV
jgi:serine/threonine protein kinase